MTPRGSDVDRCVLQQHDVSRRSLEPKARQGTIVDVIDVDPRNAAQLGNHRFDDRAPCVNSGGATTSDMPASAIIPRSRVTSRSDRWPPGGYDGTAMMPAAMLAKNAGTKSSPGETAEARAHHAEPPGAAPRRVVSADRGNPMSAGRLRVHRTPESCRPRHAEAARRVTSRSRAMTVIPLVMPP